MGGPPRFKSEGSPSRPRPSLVPQVPLPSFVLRPQGTRRRYRNRNGCDPDDLPVSVESRLGPSRTPDRELETGDRGRGRRTPSGPFVTRVVRLPRPSQLRRLSVRRHPSRRTRRIGPRVRPFDGDGSNVEGSSRTGRTQSDGSVRDGRDPWGTGEGERPFRGINGNETVATVKPEPLPLNRDPTSRDPSWHI